MSSIIKLSPLDKEGVRFDRPSHEVAWQKLTNCLFKDGSIVPRPGFQPVYDIGSADFPSLELTPLVYIGQIRNPGSSASGRESVSYSVETVRPDASSDIVAGWTNDHTTLDETPPNGTDFIFTSTTGAIKGIEFGAATFGAEEFIIGFVLRGRARTIEPNSIAELTFYLYENPTLIQIGDPVLIWATTGEADPWVEFAIPVASHPAGGAAVACEPFYTGNFNDKVFAVKLSSTQVAQYEALEADANGTYSQWKDASDSGTAVFGDVAGALSTLVVGTAVNTTTNHHMVPASSGSGTGNKQSFGFSIAQTYTTLSSVRFVGHMVKGDPAEPVMELYWRSAGGTETLVSTARGKVGSSYLSIDSDYLLTNPGGGAWSQTDFDAGEFFIKCIVGGVGTVLTHVGVEVRGITNAPSRVEIDYLALDISSGTEAVPGNGIPDYSRLFSSARNHYRVDADGTIAVTDVTNSVAVTTASHIPLDSAILYGQVYLVNGKDATRVYPNGSDVYTSLTANGAGGGLLTGRTVASFGNRILYGWVTDVASVTPERIAYSKFNDGSTHNHVSAGDFDLLDTPGGVVKLIQLNEDILVALKEEGVYNIIKTGQAAFPFRRDVIDPETGCVAALTAKRVTLKDGSPAVLFLGENPSKGGINVFMFNGSQVVPVGNPIVRKLEEDTNKPVLMFSFAEVDPITGTYWLFVAEGCENLLPNSAWIMDINSLSWTRAEFPFFVSCAGQWNLLADVNTTNTSGIRSLRGERNFIIGTSSNMPFNPVYSSPADILKVGDTSGLAFTDAGNLRKPFISIIETGDLVRPNDVQIASYRLHMEFTLKYYTLRVAVSSSIDGGETFNTEIEKTIGTDVNFDIGEKVYSYLDLTPSHSHITRYRIEIGPDDSDTLFQSPFPFHAPWQLDDLRIELVETANGA